MICIYHTVRAVPRKAENDTYAMGGFPHWFCPPPMRGNLHKHCKPATPKHGSRGSREGPGQCSQTATTAGTCVPGQLELKWDQLGPTFLHGLPFPWMGPPRAWPPIASGQSHSSRPGMQLAWRQMWLVAVGESRGCMASTAPVRSPQIVIG
ncbi:hypothetical protein BO94DRAFT_134923 [Aspergillus sclerotioniger CBS 115572]|uniref:Uncharacterized protein n=1 Tax=Aspergillus sclerotioniger CBS 115572 TaxID=1450535 RepID=A0A317XAV0_9EURO|nr:hypothetical protein BO94DRAFT_134923 [Aspergillus sclerotioniger CBS 115572]PWY95724.1 hypothetical protein BO94DRAFT_134923 [Aspergillus sclerotioniger CBS 115572]